MNQKAKAAKYEHLKEVAWRLSHICAVEGGYENNRLAAHAHVKAKRAAGDAFCPVSEMGSNSFLAGQEKVVAHMRQAARHTKAMVEVK